MTRLIAPPMSKYELNGDATDIIWDIRDTWRKASSVLTGCFSIHNITLICGCLLFKVYTYTVCLHILSFSTVSWHCCFYCTVLYCTVLYCTVLYCTVLYSVNLYCVLYKPFPSHVLVQLSHIIISQHSCVTPGLSSNTVLYCTENPHLCSSPAVARTPTPPLPLATLPPCQPRTHAPCLAVQ